MFFFSNTNCINYLLLFRAKWLKRIYSLWFPKKLWGVWLFLCWFQLDSLMSHWLVGGSLSLSARLGGQGGEMFKSDCRCWLLAKVTKQFSIWFLILKKKCLLFYVVLVRATKVDATRPLEAETLEGVQCHFCNILLVNGECHLEFNRRWDERWEDTKLVYGYA